MRRSKKRNHWHKFFYSRPVILLCAVLVIMMLRSVWQMNTKRAFVASEKEAVETELQRLAERKKTLEANLQFLTSARNVEAEIRKKFFVAKEGEKVIAVLPPASVPLSSAAATTTSWLKKWEEFWERLGVR